MKIEEYKRELTGNGYRIVGSTVYSKEDHDYASCEPIEFFLSRGSFCRPSPSDEPFYDNLEDLIAIAETEIPDFNEITEDFEKNYAEILRGNRPDWQLGGFTVFVGGIELGFGHLESGAEVFLFLVGAQKLWLTFKAPRTRLGFNPIYNVRIEHDGKKHCFTKVEEDLGYTYREIEFKLIDPTRKDNVLHTDNQYLEVTEYTDV